MKPAKVKIRPLTRKKRVRLQLEVEGLIKRSDLDFCRECGYKHPAGTPHASRPLRGSVLYQQGGRVKRSDLEVRLVPEADVFKGKEIVLAYENPFGGAGIYLTPSDALELSDDLRAQVAEILVKDVEQSVVKFDPEACLHTRTERGTVYEACLGCGAVRDLRGPFKQWHSCSKCRR